MLHVFGEDGLCYMSLEKTVCVTCLWRRRSVLHVFGEDGLCYMSLEKTVCVTCLWRRRPVLHVFGEDGLCYMYICLNVRAFSIKVLESIVFGAIFVIVLDLTLKRALRGIRHKCLLERALNWYLRV